VQPFGNVLELVPLAEEVTKLNAVCVHCSQSMMCGFIPRLLTTADAAFSQRIGSETQVEVIGGADKYVATCRECFAMFAKQAQETPATPSTPVRPMPSLPFLILICASLS
jgi:thymidine kinase